MDSKKYLLLNSRDEMFRVDISKIAYFEADGNYTNFVMCNGLRGTVCMNLAQMQTVLSERLKEAASTFARIGKSYIVNLNFVYQIAIVRQKLVLSDGATFDYQLSISKEALRSLRELYVKAVSKVSVGNE